MVRPLASVIIAVRNGEATLGAQLAALTRQRSAPPFEVIVADNGSTDGTADLVRRWVADLDGAVSGVLVDAGARRGVTFARNRGAVVSTGACLLFCDADDVVGDEWVATMTGAVMTVDGLVGGPVEAFDRDGTPRPDASANGLWGTRFLPFAAGGNMAISRECFFDVGGFDESLPPYGFEDVDLSFRVQKAGHPLHFVPAARVRVTVSDRRSSIKKVYLLGKGHMVVAKRHPEWDPRDYTLAVCAADVLRLSARLPRQLITMPQHRSRLLREWVKMTGRLAGQWHYGVRGRDGTALLLGADPQATLPEGES